MSQSGEAHPLLRRYPVQGTRHTSAGDAPTPYRIHDGMAVLVGGTADAGAVRTLLEHERVAPIVDTDGRALAALWLIQATGAGLGPHHEVQISLAVAREPIPPVQAHPLALLRLLTTLDNVGMFCHGLWNDSPLVVAYNREILGLDARPMCAQFVAIGGHVDVTCDERQSFAETTTSEGPKQALVKASVRLLSRTSLRAAASMAALLGLWRVARLSRQPWQESQIINPVGPRATNQAARACIAGSATGLDFWDPRHDRLELAAESYAKLDFTPCFIEQFHHLNFVYLEPERWGGVATA